MTRYIEIVTTTDSEEEAIKIADEILRQKLAACCSIVSVSSSFWWKNRIEHAREWQLTAKTLESRYVEVENLILEFHSYETPQIISVPILGGYVEYMNWLREIVDQ